MANISNVTASISSSSPCLMTIPTFNPDLPNRPSTVHPTWTVIATVNGLATPPMVIINALVIWTVMRDENLRSSSYNTVLASLAMTDLLVGLTVQPSFCFYVGCLLDAHCPISPHCAFSAYSLSLLACSGLSLTSLTIACMERYFAIEHQTFYLNNITWTRIVKMILFGWFICLAYLLPSTIFLNRNYSEYTKIPSILFLCIDIAIILYCSSSVQLTAYRQGKAINQQIASVQQSQQSNEEKKKKLKEYKKVFLMSMLVISSIVFCLPSIIVAVIEKTKGDDITSDFKYIATMIAATFIQLQSLINPIVMAIRLSYIRRGIKKYLFCFTQEDNQGT